MACEWHGKLKEKNQFYKIRLPTFNQNGLSQNEEACFLKNCIFPQIRNFVFLEYFTSLK
jgi:hypothetical protein